MWKVIRIMRAGLDAPMVAIAADVTRAVAGAYLRKLTRNDVLVCTAVAVQFPIYKLRTDPGPHLPGSEAARLWAARTGKRRDTRSLTQAERNALLMSQVRFLNGLGYHERAAALEARIRPHLRLDRAA